MELITGYQLEDHVTSMHDAMWHRGIWKDDCIISVGENLKAEVISNNEIRVRSGILNMQGKFCSIDMNTYDSLTINNGTAGENRIDLIVARYEKNNETQVEDVSLKVIQGTPSTTTPSVPSYTEGNIDNGDLIAELPVFQVNLNGINIESVDTLLNVESAFTEAIQVKRVKLFDGAVKTGSLTLNDNVQNYRTLCFLISSGQTGIPFGYGSYVTIDPSLLSDYGGQSPLCTDAVAHTQWNTNAIVLYSGRMIFDPSQPNKITIDNPFHNVIIRAGQSIGGATEYYIRNVWGIR